MESLYLLIPLSVMIIIGVSWIFLRMASQGQFDDLDSPAQSILLDDDRSRASAPPQRKADHARTPASPQREADRVRTPASPLHDDHAHRANTQHSSGQD